MMTRVRSMPARVALVLAGTLALTGGAAVWWQATHVPKRFATVVEGRLYRSGEITPTQLEHLHRTQGVRRVISLLDPNVPESQAERRAAERLGIAWHNIPMRGNGASTPEARKQVIELLRDANAPPTLVHCAAGVNRTGLAIGLYRLYVDGWPLERVFEELRAYDFENLPKHENMRQALRDAAAEVHGGTAAASAAPP